MILTGSNMINREELPDNLTKSLTNEDQVMEHPETRRLPKRKCNIVAHNDGNSNKYQTRKRRRNSNSAETTAFSETIVEKPCAHSRLVIVEKTIVDSNASPTEIQEEDPLAVSPLKAFKKNFEQNSTIGNKFILTPVKARKISISSDVEYERIMESTADNQDNQDYPLDSIKFLNSLDIDEILDEKEVTDMLNDPHLENVNHSEVKLQSEVRKSTTTKAEILKSTLEKSTTNRRKTLRRSNTTEQRFLEDSDESPEEDEEILENVSHKQLPDDVIEKFHNTIVRLEHEIPPQHEIEQKSLRRGLTIQEKTEFVSYGPLKQGRFTKEEDKIVMRNWKRFCQVHDLRIPSVNYFKHVYHGRKFIGSAWQRRKFVLFLSNGLPHRTLRSIFIRFKALADSKTKHQNKRYTDVDDAKIIKYMKSCDLPIKTSEVLPDLLDRSYLSISKRYIQIKKKEEEKELQPIKHPVWTLSLMEDFLKHLMDITISDKVADLKDSVIPKVIWMKLQDALDINHNVLKSFWLNQFHMQLFAPRPIYFNQIKIMLIEYLYGKGIGDIKEVNWSEVVKCFDGFTTQYLVRLCPRPRGRTRFGDMVENMYENTISLLKAAPQDSCLPRLTYSNGRLEIIDILPDDYDTDK